MLVITALLWGYNPLRSVRRCPHGRRSSRLPPLVLSGQNELSQLKLFTQHFPRAGSFGQKWVKGSGRQQLQVSGINLNGQGHPSTACTSMLTLA